MKQTDVGSSGREKFDELYIFPDMFVSGGKVMDGERVNPHKRARTDARTPTHAPTHTRTHARTHAHTQTKERERERETV